MDRKISGLYKEIFTTSERKAKGTELELRIDVDGERPLNIVSGDLYSNSGKTRKYLSSFRFQEVKKTETAANEIIITGMVGEFDPESSYFTNIQVTIPLNSYPPKATVQWISSSGNTSTHLCKYVSDYFRRVQLEHDYEEGVVPFDSYETTDLSSPPPHRLRPLSITDVFAEAGIKMITVRKKQHSVPHPKGIPGEGSVWTDNELHDAMLEHFSKLKGTPQWAVWLLSAREYVFSSAKGIRLRHKGKERRGCAVFQNAIGWQSPEEKRMRLFIYVHELGHCFNLQHPWDKCGAHSSAETDGYSTMSWMNYPWTYYLSDESRGAEAFWEAFHFQFSDSELIHLRHGFRNDVIFGGNTSSEEINSKSQHCNR